LGVKNDVFCIQVCFFGHKKSFPRRGLKVEALSRWRGFVPKGRYFCWRKNTCFLRYFERAVKRPLFLLFAMLFAVVDLLKVLASFATYLAL